MIRTAKTRKPKFIIEGVWTGYYDSQRKVVHRTVHAGAGNEKLRAWAERTHAITYTDGTKLLLRVYDCKPRERVNEIHGYDSLLIAECARNDVCAVSDLPEDRVAQEEGK